MPGEPAGESGHNVTTGWGSRSKRFGVLRAVPCFARLTELAGPTRKASEDRCKGTAWRADMSSTITWGRRDTLGSAWALMMARSQPAESPSATRFEELDDAALVAACVSGQTDAFDTIVQRHRRAVYQLCYRFVPHHEDASDLSQEVFLRAFRALHRFRGQSALGTWLHRIGVNACLNRVSAKVPRQETLDETDDRWLLASASESPVARVLHAERAVRMREFVSRLPGKQRATLILRVYQEMSHQEIAQVLGISVGAVKANVFHALKNLKRLIGDEAL